MIPACPGGNRSGFNAGPGGSIMGKGSTRRGQRGKDFIKQRNIKPMAKGAAWREKILWRRTVQSRKVWADTAGSRPAEAGGCGP